MLPAGLDDLPLQISTSKINFGWDFQSTLPAQHTILSYRIPHRRSELFYGDLLLKSPRFLRLLELKLLNGTTEPSTQSNQFFRKKVIAANN